MKQDEKYFGTEGLTSTSAEFVANLAKEMLRKDKDKIKSISFVCEQISPYNNPGKSELTLGMEEDEVRGIPALMEHILHLKLLIAWLREAVKAKKRLLEKVEEKEIEHQTHYPLWEQDMKKEDYMGTLSIAERSRMYQMQTRAAVLGKMLHKDGAFEAARERLYDTMTKPREMKSVGGCNLIHYYESSVDPDIVDEVYFKLSTAYREAQAGLNAYLHAMDAAIKQHKIERDAQFTVALEKYNQEETNLSAQLSEWKSKETRRINNLKIIIPDTLRDIYEEVQRVGK